MQRRTFLAAASCTAIANRFAIAETPTAKRRVAVIGHTNRGDYGHGLDTVWKLIQDVEIVAVADADPTGLEKELVKLSVNQGFADYHKMLAEVRPEYVTICPRHVDQHHDMAIAAIQSGVKGLYIEKPFCSTPQEADEIIAACKITGTQVAIAHRNRYHPTLQQIDALIATGELGRILEIRGRGKGDRRGGGEDLWVLGGHIFNLIQYFAGDPKSCSALMLQDGRPVTANDVRPGAEGLGPLAANEVRARYVTERGLVAYYDSIANDGTAGYSYCMQIIGSKGIVALHIDQDPLAHFSPGNPYLVSSEPRKWIPITSAGVGQPETQPALVAKARNHVLGIEDLIAACENDRSPLCDASAGRTTVEMTNAVFESHRQGGKSIEFPLQQRVNALTLL